MATKPENHYGCPSSTAPQPILNLTHHKLRIYDETYKWHDSRTILSCIHIYTTVANNRGENNLIYSVQAISIVFPLAVA